MRVDPAFGHGFCPTDGKNLSSRVCRSHAVAVGRTYALTPPPLFGNILARGGFTFPQKHKYVQIESRFAKAWFCLRHDYNGFTNFFLN